VHPKVMEEGEKIFLQSNKTEENPSIICSLEERDNSEEESASFIEEENKIKENLGICVTITGIVLFAVLITTIKIFLYDKEAYPSIFYSKEELDAMKNLKMSQLRRR